MLEVFILVLEQTTDADLLIGAHFNTEIWFLKQVHWCNLIPHNLMPHLLKFNILKNLKMHGIYSFNIIEIIVYTFP